MSIPAISLHAFRSAQRAAPLSDFGRELFEGLSRSPRGISPKFFYDAAGSQLFDRICELPEYYPTRTEMRILTERAPEIAAQIGPHAEVIEFGAGSLTKVRLLLDALHAPRRYVPIDISGEHLEAAAQRLRTDYPHLGVLPVVADYTMPLVLPARGEGLGQRVGFFPGSTLGNFSPDEALAFLQLAQRLLRGGGLLLGVDLVKDPARLHAAYNDAQGVTAAFNLNLLRRANRELGTDFDLEGFSHAAFYNAPLRRIEMHLASRRAQTVTLDGQRFHFEEGETIHTENSYKFTVDGLQALAVKAGLRPAAVWTDPEQLFSVHWLQSPAAQ
ncbi:MULTISPECIES: L-histidine N(alpha)-methyltransferase [unclassified Variovorax]|uniref:L-histidine N(alpha)-methyltransferase n=1 Tax=unclassified Variovorax TaxID=663243 RepID=UPI00076C60C7|nr:MULTISPECIES: L-histidine N(alpha)-methyltransferase [unclassified Variovorax]KWT72484.1 ABC transporter ATP-binding protein [Variovorax sp. WDL1]PNG47476.1 Histidine N-alpha-methyltransferase [Variovorax sp. B2]PNG47873.1 Histidine N-alpha-methyltransferase [Variovorax sp. B4]VTV15390.1 Histidine-specific methyltransferase EgtD [Variovorax sp. WDL1]